MKLIHLISGGDVGGAKTHVLSLLQGLNRTEDVHLICFMEGPFAEEARCLGIPTTVIEGSNPMAVRKRILAIIRHDDCQLLHCHGARANMIGALVQRQARIPVISTIHSDYRLDYLGRPLAALTYGNINKVALRRFDAWIGVSDGMRQLLISRGFDPQRIFPLYNGVDFSTPLKTVPRDEWLRGIGLTPTDRTVVFGIAARISPVKDMTTLVRAFAAAVKQAPDIRLVIAGDGEQAGEIRALAKELCPEGTVFFPGWLEDVNSFYQALDVNVLTSLSETFPYALTEGARMHCATIASNVGGVPYLIDDGENGLLFEPQDVSALTAHMLTLATDAAKRRGMGEALYEKTKRDFSVQAMVEKQKHYYEIIIRRFRRPKLERDGVVICGAYGKGNGGDNAILDAIVAQLRHIDPDLPICALSRTPKKTRAAACVDSLYTLRLLAIRRRMRHAKLYLSGGGTLIQDTTSTRSLLYYLSSIRMAARAGCRVMLYGCGIGPVSRPRNCERTAKTLNRYAEIISLRDRYSEETLRALGVTTPEIRLTADPALLIDPGDTPAIRSFLHRSGLAEGTRYALFALRPWKDFDRHIAAFANAAEYAHREYGLTPVLYAMEPCRDRAALNAVAAQLRCPYLLLEAGSNGTEIVALIRRMSLVIAMRLHTLIFAAGQGVPMVGVVYDPKVSGFLDYLGQDLYLPLEEASAASLCDLIDTAMAEQMFEAENIRSLRELAAENEELARHLLTEE